MMKDLAIYNETELPPSMWEKARRKAEAKGRAEGEAKGRAEGAISTQREAVLSLLAARLGDVPADIVSKLESIKVLAELKRLFECSIAAASWGEFRKAL